MPTENALNRSAILAILIRYSLAWQEKARQEQARAAAEGHIREADVQIANCFAGLRVFGIDVAVAGVWDRLRVEYGDDVQRAIAPPAQPITEIDRMASTNVDDDFEELIKSVLNEDASPPSMPRIRDVVLDRLRIAGDAGAKAKELRDFIEQTYKTEIHEKTVGMTLYRLKKAELVRIDGRTWFLAKPEGAGTRNPGGETPGSTEDELFRKENA